MKVSRRENADTFCHVANAGVSRKGSQRREGNHPVRSAARIGDTRSGAAGERGEGLVGEGQRPERDRDGSDSARRAERK
jgi:hypothetical protein